MNILLISQVFPPKKGGVQTAAYNTAKGLSKLGHNVIVLTSKWGVERRNFHEMDSFKVYRFESFHPPEIKGIPQVSSLRIMPFALFTLPKIIKKHNIHLIHIESRLFPISFLTAAVNLFVLKRPIFLTVQGRLKVGITGFIENIFDNIITRHIYKNLNRIICVSESLKERLERFGINESKLEVIHNGVDTSEFTYIAGSNYFDKYLEHPEQHKKVLFVGRLDVQKGVEYLIRAIPKVVKDYKNVRFFILGNGNLEEHLKRLTRRLNISNYVEFISMIPLEKMPNFYSSADIFCLPSLHEGFPLSIAEALSIGLIIVASSTEGIPEAIQENKNGFLVMPKNVDELAEKLLKALNLDVQKIEEIRENNVSLAKEKYSWDIIVKKIVRCYKRGFTQK